MVEAYWEIGRQITSFYYERLLATQKESKESVKNEIQESKLEEDSDSVK